MRIFAWTVLPLLAVLLLTVPGVAAAHSGDSGCWVKIYSSENYDTEDDWDQINGPGEWRNLENLPGAHMDDWGEEINSIVTGPDAHAYFYKAEDWEGSALEVGPRRSIPDLGYFNFDGAINSMKIRCMRQ